MIEVESLTDDAKNKIVAKAFAQRDSARRRSRKAASEKRQAGMTRLMIWVQKEHAEQLRQEFSRRCAELNRSGDYKLGGTAQQQDEYQPSLFEPSHIEWKPYGRSI